MNKHLKTFMEEQVVKKLITRAEKDPTKESEENGDNGLDKKLIGAAVCIALGALLAICTVKSLLALRQANKEKEERELKELEEALEKLPAEEESAEEILIEI